MTAFDCSAIGQDVAKGLLEKPLVVTFDQAHASSDGGAVLLKAADGALGLTASLATVLSDGRAAARVTHAWADVLRQRIFWHRLRVSGRE